MIQSKNPLLQKATQEIMDKVPPQLAPVVQKIVTAGESVMYSEKTRDMMQAQLKGPGDPAELAGAGAAKLFGILFQQSRRTAPMQAMIPATTVLLFEGLGFLEEAGQVKITPEVLAEATKALGSNILQLLGVTPDRLQSLVNKHAGGPAPMAAPSAPAPGIIGSAQTQGA